jgi:MEDS: MEthanogen/methylotroph, DcmR Sensory domain
VTRHPQRCTAHATVDPHTPTYASGPRPPAHICGAFGSDFERRAALRTFFRVGLTAGERCAVLIDDEDPSDTLSAIGSAAELDQWQEAGLLRVLTAPIPDASRNGIAVGDKIDVWAGLIELAWESPTRIGGEATWWLHHVSVDKLLAYEEDLGRSMPEGLSALCLYDRECFESDVLEAAMRIHTHKVTANRLFVENTDYRRSKELV